jgi:hypothetical protein
MPTPGPDRRTARRAALVLLLAAIGCGGESQGPDAGLDPGPYTPIVVGDTVSAGLVGSSAEASFTFRVTEAGRMALFASADAPLSLTVSDSALEGSSANPYPLATVFPEGAPGDGVLARRTERFEVRPGRTYVVRATHLYGQETARFRMFLFRINPKPEHRPATVALGDTVTGERLENSADVDEFLLSAQAGAELIGYIQGDDSLAQGAVGLTVLRPDGSDLASVATDTGTTDLEERATGRFVVEVGATYRLAVQGGIPYAGVEPAVGGYRLQVSAVNRAPETGPSMAAVGDTTAGALEHVGDVDEFTITGAPGQEFNLFFQALTDTASVLYAELGNVVVPTSILSMESSGRDTSLYDVASQTVALPTSGSATVRIIGRNDHFGLDRGDYRFYVYPIDHAPETGAVALTLGDSVDGVLDLPGDVDEFQLTVPTSQLANLILESPTGRGPLMLTRLDVTGAISIATQTLYGTENGAPIGTGTGTFELAQSVYRLRVESGSGPDAFRGPYRIATYVIHPAPESVPATVTYDVPVTGESIAPVGDYDEFSFTGAKGDVLTGWFLPSGGSSPFWLALSLWQPGAFGAFAYAGQTFGGDSVETGRFILRADGQYQISVGGVGTEIGTDGAYRFTLHRLDVQPEHVPAAIAPGAVVTTETLDYAGDVDEFVLTAAANTELQITMQGMPQTALKLEVDAPVTYDSLKGTDSFGFQQATGRFLMPAGGEVRIRVYQPGVGTATGAYSFSVIPVQRAPESVPAALTRGVVVQGESLGYAGDVDEFTFTAAAGETITAYLQTPQGYYGISSARLEVVGPGTGTVLGSATSHNPSPGPYGASTGPITLTASGSYRLRISSTDDREGTGVFEVMVQ